MTGGQSLVVAIVGLVAVVVLIVLPACKTQPEDRPRSRNHLRLMEEISRHDGL